MTTIYKPALIETAEQAEALPLGTVALYTAALPQDMTALVLGGDGIDGPGWQDEHEIKEHEYVIGWTALVPIEAEEEMDTDYYAGGDGSPTRRYVTRWERA